jgi:hypothetical protein
MNKPEWVGVTADKIDAWREIFNHSQNGIDLKDACPVCGQCTLHKYYHLARVEPRELRGRSFQGQGSYWEWCSSCRSYEHMSGYVPDWWIEKPLLVNHSDLTAIPDLLDAALKTR